jgi:hypothetical protein
MPFAGIRLGSGMPIRRPAVDSQGGLFPLRLMEIGDDVLYHGRTLRLLGHEPMSVPNRRAQVEDPATGDVFEVPYDELEEMPRGARRFDLEA